MTAQALMTHTFEVRTRNAANVQTVEWPTFAGSVQELGQEGGRRESPGGTVNEPTVTHIIRMGYEAYGEVGEGERLRDIDTGTEYIVRVATWREHPPPGTLKVRAALVPSAVP